MLNILAGDTFFPSTHSMFRNKHRNLKHALVVMRKQTSTSSVESTRTS